MPQARICGCRPLYRVGKGFPWSRQPALQLESVPKFWLGKQEAAGLLLAVTGSCAILGSRPRRGLLRENIQQLTWQMRMASPV